MGICLMKQINFSKKYSKLDYDLFTSVRLDLGKYLIGEEIEATLHNEHFHNVIVIGISHIRLEDVTECLARFDADCSKEDFYELMRYFYEEKYAKVWKGSPTKLVLLFLLKQYSYHPLDIDLGKITLDHFRP